MKYSINLRIITADQTVKDAVAALLPYEGNPKTITTEVVETQVPDPADPLNTPPDPQPLDWSPLGATIAQVDNVDTQNRWTIFQQGDELYAHIHYTNEADRDADITALLALSGMLETCDVGSYVKENDYDEVAGTHLPLIVYEVIA